MLKKGKNKYILEKVYEQNKYALYSEMTYGYNECFTFHELEMLKQIAEPKKYKVSPENVIYM